MPCVAYKSLQERLANAMVAEDRAHSESHSSMTSRDRALQDTRAAVELVELVSQWHVQDCAECKAEGNEPLTAAPM